MLGTLPPRGGSVVLGKNTKVAYLDQQRTSLEDDKTVFENIIGDQTRIEMGGQTIEPYSYLERFGFSREQAKQPVGSLSGGERARVALAGLLRQSANLLVLDEPTNDLDVPTLGALESMLVDCGATVLIVTHDRWLLDRVATSLMVWSPDEAQVSIHAGNFTTYRRLQAQTRAESLAAADPVPRRDSTKPEAARAVKTKGLNFAEHRELEKLMPAIDESEKAVSSLTERLSDPATYADGGKEVGALQVALEKAKAETERLMLRWEELESKRAG